MTQAPSSEPAPSAKRHRPVCGTVPNIGRFLYKPPKKIVPFVCSGCGTSLHKSKGMPPRLGIALIVVFAVIFPPHRLFESAMRFGLFLSAALVVFFFELWVSEFSVVDCEVSNACETEN